MQHCQPNCLVLQKTLMKNKTIKDSVPDVIYVENDKAGLQAWLGIDSLVSNRSCGGLRMTSDVSGEEITALAKVMTLKYGFLGLPHGGAKAGILCEDDAPAEKKAHLLKIFAQQIKPFLEQRLYSPHVDMGITRNDIHSMLKAVGISLPRKALISEKSGWYTGLTVIESISCAAKFCQMDLSGLTAAIEGFGKVGASVAYGLSRRGVKIIGVSTSKGAVHSSKGLDVEQLIYLSKRYGSDFVNYCSGFSDNIDMSEILMLPVDILSPCARSYSITIENVSEIKARIIVPGANIPITKEAESKIFDKEIFCVPDFIANAGGVLGGTMEFAGIKESGIKDFVSTLYAQEVMKILQKSEKKSCNPCYIAEQIASERFLRVKNIAENKSPKNKLFLSALSLYRHGFIPEIFIRNRSKKYFQNRMKGIY